MNNFNEILTICKNCKATSSDFWFTKCQYCKQLHTCAYYTNPANPENIKKKGYLEGANDEWVRDVLKKNK